MSGYWRVTVLVEGDASQRQDVWDSIQEAVEDAGLEGLAGLVTGVEFCEEIAE